MITPKLKVLIQMIPLLQDDLTPNIVAKRSNTNASHVGQQTHLLEPHCRTFAHLQPHIDGSIESSTGAHDEWENGTIPLFLTSKGAGPSDLPISESPIVGPGGPTDAVTILSVAGGAHQAPQTKLSLSRAHRLCPS